MLVIIYRLPFPFQILKKMLLFHTCFQLAISIVLKLFSVNIVEIIPFAVMMQVNVING